MAFLETEKGIKIHYNFVNPKSKKTPLLFVHGFVVNWTCFAEEIEHFKKKGYPVIYYDLRGHGKSSIPKNHEDFLIEKNINDINMLLNHLKIKKVNLVGHSLGAIIAAAFAIKKGRKVNKLILIDSTGEAPEKNAIFKFFKGKHYLKSFYEKYLLKKDEVEKKIKIKPQENMRTLNVAKEEKETKSHFFFLRCLFSSNMGVVFYLADIMFNLKLENVSKISCPTLIIQSENDEFFDKKQGMKLAEQIKNSELKIFPGGHDIIIKDADLISKEIENFILKKSKNKTKK